MRALKEMRRVLKPSGELIAIEYVRSSNHLIAWFEDLVSPITCSLIGDNMNRKTIEMIKEAGFTNMEVENLVFESFFKQIRAKP
jgi:demethylmenaquinone methyltransferase/2-methoxy-6-polyprenyl-1,4-benzoquinol methylase